MATVARQFDPQGPPSLPRSAYTGTLPDRDALQASSDRFLESSRKLVLLTCQMHAVRSLGNTAQELRDIKRPAIGLRAAALCIEATQKIGAARQDILAEETARKQQTAQLGLDMQYKKKFGRRSWFAPKKDRQAEIDAVYDERDAEFAGEATLAWQIAQQQINREIPLLHELIEAEGGHEESSFDIGAEQDIRTACAILTKIPAESAEEHVPKLRNALDADLDDRIARAVERLEHKTDARAGAVIADFRNPAAAIQPEGKLAALSLSLIDPGVTDAPPYLIPKPDIHLTRSDIPERGVIFMFPPRGIEKFAQVLPCMAGAACAGIVAFAKSELAAKTASGFAGKHAVKAAAGITAKFAVAAGATTLPVFLYTLSAAAVTGALFGGVSKIVMNRCYATEQTSDWQAFKRGAFLGIGGGLICSAGIDLLRADGFLHHALFKTHWVGNAVHHIRSWWSSAAPVTSAPVTHPIPVPPAHIPVSPPDPDDALLQEIQDAAATGKSAANQAHIRTLLHFIKEDTFKRLWGEGHTETTQRAAANIVHRTAKLVRGMKLQGFNLGVNGFMLDNDDVALAQLAL